MSTAVKLNGKGLCRLVYDVWIDEDDRRMYIKATGLEYERASVNTFSLGIRRRMRVELERIGAGRNFASGHGALELWDVARNIADMLPEAYTYRTARPLPPETIQRYVAAA